MKYQLLEELSLTTEIVFNKVEPDSPLKISKKEEGIPTQRLNPSDLINLGIGGLSKEVMTIFRTLMLSHSPEMKLLMKQRGMKPPKGLLLYSPPGNGKTSLARKLGQALGCLESNVHMCCGSEFWDKYAGEAERKIRELFQPAEKMQKNLGIRVLFILSSWMSLML